MMDALRIDAPLLPEYRKVLGAEALSRLEPRRVAIWALCLLPAAAVLGGLGGRPLFFAVQIGIVAAWAIVLLILVVAASSVSFSSKSIQLAQFILMITILLPRERRVTAPANPGSYGKRRSVPVHP